MKVIVGGIVHETNTYATALWGTTGLENFTQSSGEAMLRNHQTARTCLGGMMAAASDLSIEIVPTYHAGAAPGGIISDDTFAVLKANLLDAITAALSSGDIDAICLDLHGAGVFSEEHHHDLEAEVGRSVRALTGGTMPLSCTLDLHGNIGDDMASFFDIMVGFHYFPHTDQFERGDELMRLVPGLVSGSLRPSCYVEHLPMLMPSNSTDAGWPMARANEFAAQLERRTGVVDCTIFHGFQFCDIPHVGVHIVCTTDNDEALAKATAQDMARWIWEQRDEFLLELLTAEEAVAQAMAVLPSPSKSPPIHTLQSRQRMTGITIESRNFPWNVTTIPGCFGSRSRCRRANGKGLALMAATSPWWCTRPAITLAVAPPATLHSCSRRCCRLAGRQTKPHLGSLSTQVRIHTLLSPTQ